MYFRRKTSAGRAYLQIVESRREGEPDPKRPVVCFDESPTQLIGEVRQPIKAERIRVVLDNLSTHSVGALYQAFPPGEARRLLCRLEFHYVPKHASWLNMAEIEIGVLSASITRSTSYPRLLYGSANAILHAPASSGCSQPRKHAPKWAADAQAHTFL